MSPEMFQMLMTMMGGGSGFGGFGSPLQSLLTTTNVSPISPLQTLFPGMASSAPFGMTTRDLQLMQQFTGMRGAQLSQSLSYNPAAVSLARGMFENIFGLENAQIEALVGTQANPTLFTSSFSRMFNTFFPFVGDPTGKGAVESRLQSFFGATNVGAGQPSSGLIAPGLGLTQQQLDPIRELFQPGIGGRVMGTSFGAPEAFDIMRMGASIGLFSGVQGGRGAEGIGQQFAGRTEQFVKLIDTASGLLNAVTKEETVQKLMQLSQGNIGLSNVRILEDAARRVDALADTAGRTVDSMLSIVSQGTQLANKMGLTGASAVNIGLMTGEMRTAFANPMGVSMFTPEELAQRGGVEAMTAAGVRMNVEYMAQNLQGFQTRGALLELQRQGIDIGLSTEQLLSERTTVEQLRRAKSRAINRMRSGMEGSPETTLVGARAKMAGLERRGAEFLTQTQFDTSTTFEISQKATEATLAEVLPRIGMSRSEFAALPEDVRVAILEQEIGDSPEGMQRAAIIARSVDPQAAGIMRQQGEQARMARLLTETAEIGRRPANLLETIGAARPRTVGELMGAIGSFLGITSPELNLTGTQSQTALDLSLRRGSLGLAGGAAAFLRTTGMPEARRSQLRGQAALRLKGLLGIDTGGIEASPEEAKFSEGLRTGDFSTVDKIEKFLIERGVSPVQARTLARSSTFQRDLMLAREGAGAGVDVEEQARRAIETKDNALAIFGSVANLSEEQFKVLREQRGITESDIIKFMSGELKGGKAEDLTVLLGGKTFEAALGTEAAGNIERAKERDRVFEESMKSLTDEGMGEAIFRATRQGAVSESEREKLRAEFGASDERSRRLLRQDIQRLFVKGAAPEEIARRLRGAAAAQAIKEGREPGAVDLGKDRMSSILASLGEEDGTFLQNIKAFGVEGRDQEGRFRGGFESAKREAALQQAESEAKKKDMFTSLQDILKNIQSLFVDLISSVQRLTIAQDGVQENAADT